MSRLLSATVWLVFGALAGVALWFCSIFIVATVALWPSVAVATAPFVALAIWLIGAGAYLVIRWRRHPRPASLCFVAGVPLFSIVAASSALLNYPHAILFWPQ